MKHQDNISRYYLNENVTFSHTFIQHRQNVVHCCFNKDAVIIALFSNDLEKKR